MSDIQQFDIRYTQNFLKSRHLVTRLLDMCNITPSDTFYEIGAGSGIITKCLAQRCRSVVAIEKDAALIADLRFKFAGMSNIRLHEGDFLEYNLPDNHYKVFANIPFNITSAIVTRLTTVPVPPDDTYLIMQKEAAERFIGKPHETLYGVLLKPCFDLALLYSFKRSDFAPAPRVDVVMLRLRKRGPPLIAHKEMALFRDFVVYSFTTPRPCLRKTFKHIFTPHQLKLLSSGLDLNFDVTPTTLTFEQWVYLFDSFKHFATSQAIHMVMGSELRLRQQQTKLEKMHRTHIFRRKQ